MRKAFPLYRESKFIFRAEAYNIGNTPEYASPDTNLSDSGLDKLQGLAASVRVKYGLTRVSSSNLHTCVTGPSLVVGPFPLFAASLFTARPVDATTTVWGGERSALLRRARD